MNCARNYKNLFNFVNVMLKILAIPYLGHFFRLALEFFPTFTQIRKKHLLHMRPMKYNSTQKYNTEDTEVTK